MEELLKYLAGKIDEELDVFKEDLAKGLAKDHGDYKFSCGCVRGLLTAKNIIIETAERMRQNDERG